MKSLVKQTAYLSGRWAEKVALQYLLEQNLTLLERNFRSTFGEIDLIMQDAEILCFIEVRYRAKNYLHTALESIDKKKCERIILTSQHYYTSNRKATKMNGRFDIITLSGKQKKPLVEWIKNAFMGDIECRH